jgi:UDP:flavonoid glycosyltransferase YjiC (YdhE family)
MVETQLNGEFANLRDRCNLPSCASIAHWWHRSPYRIALWPDWFQKVTDSEIVQAGFVSWSGEARDTACPDTHPNAGIRASIVITGGTGYFAGAEFFRVSSEACIQLGKVCLIVCRNRALLDAALPPSIQHVLWAPSLAGLISQSELIIHHGGMGIIGLSVMAGIPQLCLAAGGDRPRNARIVKELGLGDYLVRSEWSSTAVAAMIKSLGANSYRVRCKYRSQQTDRLDAINRAVAFFEAISCS